MPACSSSAEVSERNGPKIGPKTNLCDSPAQLTIIQDYCGAVAFGWNLLASQEAIQSYHPNDSWGLEGPLKHFWTVDLQVRLDVTRRLVKSLAALAIPDSLRRQRWVPASPRGQHADR